MDAFNLGIFFLLGFLGSAHCIGMCGPIVLSLSQPLGIPSARHSPNQKGLRLALHWRLLAYQVGRVWTYSLLGLVFGAGGQFLSQFTILQRAFSIVAGFTMVAIILIGGRQFGLSQAAKIPQRLGDTFRGLLRSRGLAARFLLGVCNGLLPCGLVYVVLIQAMATGNPPQAGLGMAAFGVGTVPAMYAVSLFPNLPFQPVRIWGHRLAKAFLMAMALVLILRGFGVAILHVH